MNLVSHRICQLGLVAATVAPVCGFAQVRTLGDADAAYPESFSLVQQVRELPDGRVMVADPLEQKLVVLDMSAGTEVMIGRVGQGPTEYSQPDAVFPMPGDSTLLIDLGNGRLTMIGPDFSFGPTMPIAQEGEASGPRRGPGGGMTIVMPRWVDAEGRLYFQPFGGMRPGMGIPDSAVIARWDRATKQMDTLGMVKRAEVTRRSSGGANNRQVNMVPVPLSPQDGWGVGANGRIAVARTAPYRLDWIDPDGRLHVGEPVDYQPVRIRTAEKEEWVSQQGSAGLSVGVQMVNGVRSMSFGRGGGGGRGGSPDIDGYEWPTHKPPFASGGVFVSPSGDAWVRRSQRAGEPHVYDVFDAEGRHKEQIQMAPGRQIVGFGRGVVYTIMRDEFDLQYLERYRITS